MQHGRDVQKQAITRWLSAELAAIHGPEIPGTESASRETVAARARFVEAIIPAVEGLIDGSEDVEDAIAWAMISIARLHGASLAIRHHGDWCAECVAGAVALVGGQIGNAVLLHCDAGEETFVGTIN